MPVSKRDKKVSLTKTKKKGMPLKQHLVEDIRKFLDKYDNLFVFTINNMRNGPLKDLREEWNDSRFFFGKRKIMALALGRTEAEEVQKNIHKLASHLVGQCGLLFTDRPKDQVIQWFQDYTQMEFAKSGFVATETVTLPAGPLTEFSFSLEPHLRALGLPTQLEKGTIILREDFTVCSQGSRLTPEQASILKLIGEKMAEFKVKIVCMWSKDGSFERFKVLKLDKQYTPGKSPKLKNKQKNKSRVVESENRSEEEISQLFDQQSLNECEMDHENNDKLNENNEDNRITKPEEKNSTQLENEDELMNDDCKKHPENEEGSNVVEKSTKKKSIEAKIMEDIVNDKSEKTIGLQKEETSNKKLGKEKSQENPGTEETISKEGFEGQSETKEKENGKKPVNESPKITRENPRRSMRTPKPIRRSPEEKQSVKKLTESSRKTKSAIKDNVTKPVRGTPRKSVSKRIFEDQNDVEMAE